MNEKLCRELRLLKAYVLTSTLAVAVLVLAAFQQEPQKQKFTEIDVERINIVEPDGKLRMVLSNRPRSIGPIYKGQPFGYAGGTRPGIIFFNDEGTENGGLVFTGSQRPDGTYASRLGMSFDQFNQDQVVVLAYADNNGEKRMGLTIGERAPVDIFELIAERDSINRTLTGAARDEALRRWAQPRNGVPLYAERVYVGRTTAGAAVLNLSDAQGRPRLRLVVDSAGSARVEFLDESGTVTSTLPGAR